MFQRIFFLLLAFVICQFQSATSFSEFTTTSGKIASLELCQKDDLKICEEIFIRSFSKAYEKLTPEQLGVKNVQTFLKEAFADVYDDFQTGHQKLVIAKIDGKIVGFAGFKPAEEPNQIYITQLSVDTDYWHQGIGKQLVFSALDLYENTEKLVVIARKLNTVAQQFYEKLGFVKSPYMHPGYSPAKYTGYEWTKP